jgi:hypothetical protein
MILRNQFSNYFLKNQNLYNKLMYINGGDHSPFDYISTTFLSELSDARFINSQNLGQQNSSWKSVKSVCLVFL